MVKHLLEAGWKMSEIMDSPLYYLAEVLREKNKPKKATSVMDLP